MSKSQFPISVIAIVRVCFLNSSEFGLFAREELGGCSEGWEELEVARKVAHLLGKHYGCRKVSSPFLSLPLFVFAF